MRGNWESIELLLNPSKSTKHPKCKGYYIPDPGHGWGDDGGCEYETEIDCDECKYNGQSTGRKDPEAKCNQIKE